MNMKKIKVLHFPIRNNTGGVAQYILSNWKYIDKTRFRFDFATLSKSLDFEKELTEQGCRVHYISCSAEENESRFAAEFETILSEGYDAVHLHTSYWKSFICEEVAKKAGVPVVIVHSHNSDIGVTSGGLSREAAAAHHNRQRLNFSADMATHFCACSRTAADWLFGDRIPRENIIILNNAIETERFSYNPDIRETYRREMGLQDSFVIGHVGRFEYQKNHEFLIDVFAETVKSVHNAKLILIGSGSMFDIIKAKAERAGLSDRVLFLGTRTDTAELYQAMDLFVLPSFFEGLGIVLVEAQTSGVKCIISAAAALPENTITDNISSLPFDSSLWSGSIAEIAQNGYDRRDCSKDVTAAGYSIARQVSVLERIYSGEKQCVTQER